jgi:hypothetical protein
MFRYVALKLCDVLKVWKPLVQSVCCNIGVLHDVVLKLFSVIIQFSCHHHQSVEF